ncbi:sensor histidine kinase [Nucisporomicrobium flavum]|uniref:sensor histidine kinase n=1 Tax=Nucisporomicrobium flavum TaxID=2785915 RepID=UPI0018F7098C|nr:ATP-binding protein [Nucisporomicrobium flavum]
MNRRSWMRRPGRWSGRILALVVVLGVAGTAMAAVALRRADDDRRERALSQQTFIVTQAVQAEMRRYSTSLTDLSAAIGAQSQLEAAEFTAITAPVDRQRLPGVTGVVYVVPATTAQIPQVQRYWRDRGTTDLVLQPTDPDAAEHFFVVLDRATEPTTGPAIGRDAAGSPEALEVLRRSRDSHRIATSRTYRLLRDEDVPANLQQLSFTLAAPVYSTSPAARDLGRFRGWLLMALRAKDFLHQAISGTVRDTVAVTLSDAGDGVLKPVASWTPAAAVDRDLPPRAVTVAVPQRTWALTVTPTRRLLPDTDLHRDLIAWIVGLVITGLLAALTGTVITARNRALRRVDEATAALRDDIARREAVEQQLRRRESELVGFAGVVAHDLRSPLSRITGYADFLREEAAGRLDPVHRDFLERLYAGAQRMQSLIDDLLDYAMADNRLLTSAQVDLGRLVDDIVRERVTGLGDRPAAVTVEPLPTVAGDPVLLRQVLDNLIGNALKYTPYGHDPSVEVTCRPDGTGWRIEVADHGIGIPPEQRETVFTAFTRAGGSEGYPGTGLGLAIVHRIVERHGGRVGVDGNDGGGSRFWFTLPGEPAPAEPSGAGLTAQPEKSAPTH